MTHTYIIAEAGVNHNGSVKLAIDLVDLAKDSGADAVKFQTFKAKNLAGKSSPKANYQLDQNGHHESQFEMLERLEFTEKMHEVVLEHCKKRNIQFLSTPFDVQALKYLVNEIKVPIIKLGSGEITNGPLLFEAGLTRMPIILSTGMSTLLEVKEALRMLAWGFCKQTQPLDDQLESNFESTEAQDFIRRNVTLLHCTTEYPTPFEDVNLRAIVTLKTEFGVGVGFSDHTPGIVAPIGAVALGATIIEKHFTLDKTLPGPDHKASLCPQDLKDMIRSIREIEKSLGSGNKIPAPSEQKNIAIARRSLIASKPIDENELFTIENLTAKRPGTGISPMQFWKWLGKPANRSYREDELIDTNF